MDGIDLIAIGANDLAKSLGVAGQADHPSLVAAIDRISTAVNKGGVAHLSLGVGQSAFPRTLPQLRKLGVQYMHCGPQTEVRILNSMSEQVAKLRSEMGR